MKMKFFLRRYIRFRIGGFALIMWQRPSENVIKLSTLDLFVQYIVFKTVHVMHNYMHAAIVRC
jgi:hypothetical protein